MGYYPTPVDVVARVKEMLHMPEGARLLDPCCGEGEALALLADGTGASTYGVELDKDRIGERERVEVQFLKKYWDCLQPKGVLVYIIPATSARYAAPFLCTRCTDLAVMRFPAHFWDFKQMVIICIKARPGRDGLPTPTG